MAAAIVAAKKTRRRASLEFVMDDLEIELHSKIPVDRKRKLDIELNMLLGGRWELRRIILTRNELVFAVPKEDEVRDHIPLHEIVVVEPMTSAKSIDLLRQSLLAETDPSTGKPNGKDTNEKNKEKQEDLQELNTMKTFQIETIPHGYNSGRTYFFQADTKETCVTLVEVLNKYTEDAMQRMTKKSRFEQTQKWVQKFYYSKPFQFISSALIVMNFGLSIAAAQVSVGQASKESREKVLDLIDTLDLFFVLVFTGELVINMYANWWKPFFKNPWSVFDLIVVGVSLIGLSPLGVPLGMLLLARSCRVLRIFGKFKAVAQIFAALSWSIMPMANVFFIIFVIASIYAVIAVTFFAHQDPEHLSSFARAFVSMFRITIGSVEWWFDTFPAVKENGSLNVWPSFFLITYVITVTWVFFQVSIAVLLDNFLSASNAMKLAETIESIREKQATKLIKNPLDPLLLRLSKDYTDEVDLSQRLQELFKVLDSSGSGWLTSREFQIAMKKLDVQPRIFVSDSDFIAMTREGTLCNEKGQLGIKEFEIMMHDQIRMYTLSRLSSTSEYWSTSDQEFTPIGALKQILMEQITLRRDHDASLAEVRGALSKNDRDLERVLAALATLTAASGGDPPKGPGSTEPPAKAKEPGSETDPSPREVRPISQRTSAQSAAAAGSGSISPTRRSVRPRRVRPANAAVVDSTAPSHQRGSGLAQWPPSENPQLRAPGAPGMQVALLDVSSPVVLVNHTHQGPAVASGTSAADAAAAAHWGRQVPPLPTLVTAHNVEDGAGMRDAAWDVPVGGGGADYGAASVAPAASASATTWGRGRSFSIRRLKVRGISEPNMDSKVPDYGVTTVAGGGSAVPPPPVSGWRSGSPRRRAANAAAAEPPGNAGVSRAVAALETSGAAARDNRDSSERERGRNTWYGDPPPAAGNGARHVVRPLAAQEYGERGGGSLFGGSSGDGSGDADDGGGRGWGGRAAAGPGRF